MKRYSRTFLRAVVALLTFTLFISCIASSGQLLVIAESSSIPEHQRFTAKEDKAAQNTVPIDEVETPAGAADIYVNDFDEQFGAVTTCIETGENASVGDILKSHSTEGLTDVFIAEILYETFANDAKLTFNRNLTVNVDNVEPIAFVKGETISLNDAIAILLASGDSKLRNVIREYVEQSGTDYSAGFNLLAKRLKTTNTKVVNLFEEYDAEAYTNTYDMSLILADLLKHAEFVRAMTAESFDIDVKAKDGTTRQIFFAKPIDGVSEDIVIPIEYTLLTSRSGGVRIDGYKQFVVFCDDSGRLCVSVLLGYNDNTDINVVSGNIVRAFAGYDTDLFAKVTPSFLEEVPEKAVIPTDSNDARYQYIMNTDYQAYTMSNAPTAFRSNSSALREMRSVTLPVWKMDSNGNKYSSTYTIRINKGLVESVKAIFKEIYELDIRFPVKYMVGYAYRKVGGVGLMNCPLMSVHTFGCAIDINSGDYDNDYYLGKGNDLRDRTNPYCIPDEVIAIFKKYGWYWGGEFDICADTMHFQYFDLGFLQYDKEEPFPILKKGASNRKDYVMNLTERLVELEYLKAPQDKFNNEVLEAVINFQEDHEINADGVVRYDTWEPLINMTHYMDFVF